MYLPTWDTANGLFDHYLAVRPPSAGTTCYHHWCATLTGREHRCKVKHEWGGVWKKKGSQATSLSDVGVQTHPRGVITIMTSWVGTAQVYYSILGLQLAWEPARLAGILFLISEECLLNVGGLRQSSMWSKVGNIWRSSQSKANKLCQVGLLDSPPPPPSLAPQTCRDDLQINRKIGSAAGGPPLHRWLCVRPVLARSCLCIFKNAYVCVCVCLWGGATAISDQKSSNTVWTGNTGGHFNQNKRRRSS